MATGYSGELHHPYKDTMKPWLQVTVESYTDLKTILTLYGLYG